MPAPLRLVSDDTSRAQPEEKLHLLSEVEKKVLWLSSWMIHNANHLRPSSDGLKVGGHQSSCASAVTLLTALYMDVLRPEDRIAVKPHASPVYHSLMYLLGRQSREKLEAFRALGGAQAYPSRTKDSDDVDFSTGSVGLGVAVTLFGALVRDYVKLHGMVDDGAASGRLVALMGDAELDEGNIFEALLEGWKNDVRNLWWIIDYNRQSLDGVVNDRLFHKINDFFGTVGWNVVTLKYGKLLEAARHGPAGEALLDWIDSCPNDLYSALTFKGGESWREYLKTELSGTSGLGELLDSHDDVSLHRLMTNLAGHDMETVLEAFHAASGDEEPQCFVAYTIKGYGLPLAGHKDNHAGLMNPQQMDEFREAMRIPEGREWDPYAGLDTDRETLQSFLRDVPFRTEASRSLDAPAIDVPESFPVPSGAKLSTQQAFGQILNELAQGDSTLADHIVTTSPDVTVSTNLGSWVNQRGLFSRRERPDVFREEKVASAQKWVRSREGQHIELGIAENNLFLMLAALGLSHSLFGARLLPVGTLYDPFVNRGLDALTYACYQDARFMAVGTPAGVTLAPEGGAHQSINTPLTGMATDRLTYFEPAYVDELAAIMAWGFRHMQAEDGGSVYLRLSTRLVEQPDRSLTPEQMSDIRAGGYWIVPPGPGCDLVVAYTGAVAPEAAAAHADIVEDVPGAGLFAVTSADRLHEDWVETTRRRAAGDRTARSHVERMLSGVAPGAALVTVLDGHPATLSWLGATGDFRISALGVEKFGQSSDIPDAYRLHGIDRDAILDAAAAACLARVAPSR